MGFLACQLLVLLVSPPPTGLSPRRSLAQVLLDHGLTPPTPEHACTGDIAGADSDSGTSEEDEEQQQRGKRAKQQSPARPRSRRRRAAGQVDYRQLHEQLFGFSAFDGLDDAVFQDDEDADFDAQQHGADSDD